jgi:demethylmenaquinone methyltransferase/2-methoxy-6-polyprenyl-1,4-benzoquinol methylase
VGRESTQRGVLPTGEERARLVQEMFDRIASRYELLNTLMTAVCTASGTTRRWRLPVSVKAVEPWTSPAGPVA